MDPILPLILQFWRSFLLCLLLTACASGQAPDIPTMVSTPPNYVRNALATLVPTSTTGVAATAEATPTTSVPPTLSTPTVTAESTFSSAPPNNYDEYQDLTIEALSRRQYGGGKVQIISVDVQNDAFARYLISFPSDELEIFGFINVPKLGDNFPVAIVLHGYVPPAEYETLAYTRRYADALAEAGYFVFHPNLRNYPPSDSGSDPFRIGMAIDVLNLIAIIREQSQDQLGTLRRVDSEQIHIWGHSMGGGIALRVATIETADYLRAVLLYGAMSGDESKNYRQIYAWSRGDRGQFELDAPEVIEQDISPIYHLDRIRAPFSVHHSDSDPVVPYEWSTELCDLLEEQHKQAECFTYLGAPHTFYGPWDELFIERTIKFFDAN